MLKAGIVHIFDWPPHLIESCITILKTFIPIVEYIRNPNAHHTLPTENELQYVLLKISSHYKNIFKHNYTNSFCNSLGKETLNKKYK